MLLHSIISAAAAVQEPLTSIFGSPGHAREGYVLHPDNERRRALNKRRKSIKRRKAAGKARRRNRK